MKTKFYEKATTLNFNYPTIQEIELEKKKYPGINQNFYRRALGIETKKELNHHIVANALIFMGGMFYGVAETVTHHYEQFEERFPNANDNYWNPDKSYGRKYKNGDRAQGPKFLGSTGPLVFTTDGYHLMRFGRNLTTIAGMTINLSFKEKKKWHQYALDFGIKSGLSAAGFNIIYGGLLKK